MDKARIIDHITDWLRDYCTRAGMNGFVVGVSGGIDSALTSTLCARTGLPTVCVEMPIHQHFDQVKRAQDHITWLRENHANVRMEVVKLTSVFDQLVAELPGVEDETMRHLTLANTRARLRMTTLYYFAGLLRSLVAGTGNKVEDMGVGFFTKYGDGGVDIGPIADLTKTEVYALAAELRIAGTIQQAPPTDGLWGDERTDADQIGATYPELEWAMDLRENGLDPRTMGLTDRQREVLAIYDRLHAANKHKMEPIPVCLIPEQLR
ncbi:MAG: NAD(+) synthase [Flavobacteriales bacterium]|nr:NAD(+) synthase [Flavobacteriales bacterium]MCB9193025.1 NAD(+) synthase [Flavobacteriales bacterium]